ncbi:MAG: hypothetical protein IH946_01610, partial [Bacteroidetes bacterium]|nr:hypothetical protein [Bacteroidota bacterium]
MKVEQKKWQQDSGWDTNGEETLTDANLVLVFGGTETLSDPTRFDEVKAFYPKATILTCSTAGEIMDVEVTDETIVSTAIRFEKTPLKFADLDISEVASSYEAGNKLAVELNASDLVHVFVISDGLKVNGSQLVKGFNDGLDSKVAVTGGMAGDAARFEKTLVGIGTAPKEGKIVAMGLYGDNIQITHGSRGGWDSFGPLRQVTKSTD